MKRFSTFTSESEGKFLQTGARTQIRIGKKIYLLQQMICLRISSLLNNVDVLI